MEESLFTRIYKYRETPNKAANENYLTEILAYCLEIDDIFRAKFFSEVIRIDYKKEEIKINTQMAYEKYGIPDIEINFQDTILLIECKIEQKEGDNQLENYSNILTKLKSKISNRHLIYLTKYYDQKEFESSIIDFHQIRWFSIYDLINDDNLQITKELKSFLKDLGMEKVKNFNIQDLLALQIIPMTLSKMDEVIDSVKNQFTKQFGGFSKDSSRSTRLINSHYSNYVTLNYEGSEYWIDVGFFWWNDEVEIPKVCVMIEYPQKKFDYPEFKQILKKELVEKHGWKQDTGDNRDFILVDQPLTDFIEQEMDSVPAIREFLLDQFKILEQIQKQYPKMLKK